MALQTFTWRAAYGSDPSYQADVREFMFGDGYSQTSPKGLNPVKATIQVSCPGLTLAQKDAALNFLVANVGRPFLYAHDGGPARKFTCDEWTERKQGPGVYEVSAKFKQVYTNQA